MAEVVFPEETITATPPAGTIPDWDTDPSWNTVQLGSVVLPGVCMIDGLKVGVEVETKKAKGSDKPTSKDNGVDPSKFKIIVRLTKAEWPEFLNGLPTWNPRANLGKPRGPVKIIHQWVNAFEIDSVRIISVEGDQPTAKSGAVITINVEEWFDAPVAVKQKPKVDEAKRRKVPFEVRQAYLNDVRSDPSGAAKSDFYNKQELKEITHPEEIPPGGFFTDKIDGNPNQ